MTRTAKPGSKFRQERYASSFTLGLAANLVAKKTARLIYDEERASAAIWFVQWLSWQPCGLFELKEYCRVHGDEHAKRHAHRLEDFCLSPDGSFCFFTDVVLSFADKWRAERPEIANTAVTKKVFAGLDAALETRSLSLLTGPTDTGRNFAALDWCARSCGRARAVIVKPTPDDRSFFNQLAVALGVSCSRGYSLAEVRERIEKTLAVGDVMPVFLDASFLLPRTRWCARPDRINWIVSHLANASVPVALIGGTTFHDDMARVEDFGWDATEFCNAIGHYDELPAKLQLADLRRVADMMFPDLDADSLAVLVKSAFNSKQPENLAFFRSVRSHAESIAKADKRERCSAQDVKQAIKYFTLPQASLLPAVATTSIGAPHRSQSPRPPQRFGEAHAGITRQLRGIAALREFRARSFAPSYRLISSQPNLCAAPTESRAISLPQPLRQLAGSLRQLSGSVTNWEKKWCPGKDSNLGPID